MGFTKSRESVEIDRTNIYEFKSNLYTKFGVDWIGKKVEILFHYTERRNVKHRTIFYLRIFKSLGQNYRITYAFEILDLALALIFVFSFIFSIFCSRYKSSDFGKSETRM